MNWKEEAKKHFIKCSPSEGCGLLVERGGNEFFFPCKNIASHIQDDITFAINPLDFAACEDSGADILAVIHSHVEGSAEPSEADLNNCKLYMMDWYIYSIQDDNWHFMETDL
jgi:proteasome lid subunit RPN8/RPN11|tara:strand:+ start:1378 stop:1713 length:336 start_codon:yes stop_codon:yes gene_type:complete